MKIIPKQPKFGYRLESVERYEDNIFSNKEETAERRTAANAMRRRRLRVNMKRDYESSDISTNRIEVRPGELMCACCVHGGASCTSENAEDVERLLKRIRQDSNVHIILKTAFDETGARTELYERTTPAQRKRDLDILREMGATPETVRTAQAWSELLTEYIPKVDRICSPHEQQTDDWRNCPNTHAGFYEKGLKNLCRTREECEMFRAKVSSCEALKITDSFSVRAHHFLCMICFVGGKCPDEPLQEDNLYELWQKILCEPEVAITVIEGPGDCIVCPPCYAYNPESKLCCIAGSLRDRKKDLDVFSKLSMLPGDTLPAKKILYRIYKNIKDVDGLCRFEERRGFEWRNCRTHDWGTYEKGLRIVAEALSFQE